MSLFKMIKGKSRAYLQYRKSKKYSLSPATSYKSYWAERRAYSRFAKRGY